ncbi:MAG: cytochrome d ubiquinol oxidase subunit II, partial [Streptosporangiaceae bacterium]
LALLALAVLGFAWGRSPRDRRAFAGSVLAIVGLLGSAAATVFPNLLRSTLNPGFSLTIYNAAAGAHGLRAALIANGIALAAVGAYSSYVHGVFRGKVRLSQHPY